MNSEPVAVRGRHFQLPKADERSVDGPRAKQGSVCGTRVASFLQVFTVMPNIIFL